MPYPTQWAEYDPQKFMCCLCFEIFNITECAIDDTGQKIDVCEHCWIFDNNTVVSNNKDIQHNHNPIQHRDGKPPWCRECGLTESFQFPTSRFDKLQKHSRRRKRG